MQSYKSKIITQERRCHLKLLLEKITLDPNQIILITKKESFYLQILNEALTHTSAQESINHERLEFLGDAVLRLSASEFIEKSYPSMSVGNRSALRAQLVSDKWLTKVGKEIEIEKVFIVGSKALKDSSALSTLQAEATEALIGALYECLNDIKVIERWLTPYWEKESSKVLADPHKQNPKSALQEWSQRQGLPIPMYELVEISQEHGNPKRFFCKVKVQTRPLAEGWGGSRKEAEKEAAKAALNKLDDLASN